MLNYGDLLGGGADVRMHVPFALGGIVLAQILDILILGLLLFGLFALLQRLGLAQWTKLLLAIGLPPYLFLRLETLFPTLVRDDLTPLLACLWGALVLLLLLRFPTGYRRLLTLGDAAGVFLALFAAFSIAQLVFVAFWRPPANQRLAAWQQTPQPPRRHPLIVWIIFDELSYDQLFEHRARDLALPNFDRLRAESVLFTNVQPVGYKTVKILPSLLTGRPIDDYQFRFDNRFLVHYTGEHGLHPLAGDGTIFHTAQQAGWRTAAVGWYNPYCTIYASALDSCYWQNLDRIDGLMSQRNTVLRNAALPLKQMALQALAPTHAESDACDFDVRRRLTTEVDLQQHASQLLHTGQADFVFLHLAIPHSPNIWSRLDNAYTNHCDSSYLDNLALVDRTLGDFLHTLETSPRWPDTTLIVQGDHGWRIDLWNWQPSWTDEDTEASRSVFDPRPALLIHQVGETSPKTIATPWPLVKVHDVMQQILEGQSPNYTP